jgi:hypothetical protein
VITAAARVIAFFLSNTSNRINATITLQNIVKNGD